MRIARIKVHGNAVIAVGDDKGFVDYGAVLEARGFRADDSRMNSEHQVTMLLERGLLDEEFLSEQMEWVRKGGGKYALGDGDLQFLLPLKPGKIVCVARNWESHAREGGHNLPDRPIFFGKTSNCAIGPTTPIPVPQEVGRVDHEGELGVVIRKRAKRVQADNCGEYILGYTCVNDVTARAYQHELSKNSWPWYAAKSMDGFAPIGPTVVTRDEAEPITGKRIRVTVNGDVRQDGTVDDMHWKVPALLEVITRNITLEPGDIIATGTPSGIGPITPGDEVVVEIVGIGRLVNPVERG